MKKVFSVLFMIIILLAVFYIWKPFESDSYYEFRNETESIVSIELLYNSNEQGLGTDKDQISLIRMLDRDEIPVFMEEVGKIPVYECYPPWYGWGCYIAKVTYSSGAVEMLGSHSIEYVAARQTAVGCGVYSFEEKLFIELVSEYMDSDRYPFTGY